MNIQINSKKCDMRKIEGVDMPKLLQMIPHPPTHLWVEGELPDPESYRYLCVVGSRRHSAYGRQATEELVAGLSGYNICIVSGLALGIDSIAHRSALNVGLKTIAFPGSGLDRSVLYPQTHIDLAEEIISCGGALISEFDHDTACQIWTFPQRNRLMAGISHAVLVIEAGEKSGTLITARLALDYNRDVLALPGSIFSPLAHGPNTLIRDGAIPVTSSDDILEALGLKKRDEEENDKAKAQAELCFTRELSKLEKKIVSIITLRQVDRNEIIEQIDDTETHLIIGAISLLLLDGIITKKDGKFAI